MRLQSLTLGLLAALALPTALAAQQDPTAWRFFPGTDDQTGLATGFAVLGMPETDDRALSLSCQYRPGQPLEIMGDFTAFLSTPQGGLPATLQWETDVGLGSELGQTFVGGIDEGITVRTQLGTALMNLLGASQRIIWFEANAGPQTAVNVPLTGNAGEFDQFVAHCEQIQQTQGRMGAGAPTPGTAALVPDVGPTQTGHDWTRFSDIRDDVFQTVLTLAYGVPETDDVLVTGQCVIGAQGPLVVMQIAADIEGFFEGNVARLRIRDGAGQSFDVDGSVIGTTIEEGVAGLEVVMEPRDPVWQMLTAHPVVQFERIGGRGGFTLTGNGPAIVSAFLSDCDRIGDLRPQGAPAPTAPGGPQAGALSCDDFGRVASGQSGPQNVLTFVNDSGMYRALSWIDPAGRVVDQGGMNAGEALSFTTGPGHVWMATDGPGNCLEMIQPLAGQTEYRLLPQ